ncbi:MAG: hypothetical protein JO293_01640 [Candidatus Eremiobacteraeota bacterium]|nr:hypothetical protein [Candidatus Eremiobacteraeota bacterium]
MIIAVVVFVLGVVCIAFGIKQAREAGEVSSTFVMPVSRVVTGPTAVQGSAKSSNTSVAPLSGKRCVYWHVKLSELQGRSQREVADEVFPGADFCFTVEDDSGGIPVLGAGAQLLVAREDHSTQNEADSISDAGRAWVAAAGRDWHHTKFWEAILEITEERIEDGALTYVLGTASAPSDLPPERQTPEIGSAGAVIWQGKPPRDLIISDKDPQQTARSITAGGVIGFGTAFLFGIGLLLAIGGAWIFWAWASLPRH